MIKSFPIPSHEGSKDHDDYHSSSRLDRPRSSRIPSQATETGSANRAWTGVSAPPVAVVDQGGPNAGCCGILPRVKRSWSTKRCVTFGSDLIRSTANVSCLPQQSASQQTALALSTAHSTSRGSKGFDKTSYPPRFSTSAQRRSSARREATISGGDVVSAASPFSTSFQLPSGKSASQISADMLPARILSSACRQVCAC